MTIIRNGIYNKPKEKIIEINEERFPYFDFWFDTESKQHCVSYPNSNKPFAICPFFEATIAAARLMSLL